MGETAVGLTPLPVAIPGLNMQVGELNVVPLASVGELTALGDTDSPSISLTAAAGFLWTQLSIISERRFAWVLKSSNVDSNFTVDDSEVPGQAFRGDGLDGGVDDIITPIQLPCAHWFPGSTTLTAKVTNLEAGDNDLTILLIGLRIRSGTLLEDHIQEWWLANREGGL